MTPEPAVPQPEQVAAFFRKHRTGLLTLVFTDLVDSVALMQRLGDQPGTTFLQRRRQLVRETLRAFPEGEEIETAGDSFLLIFSKPSDAVRFGLLVQGQLRGFSRESGLAVQERMGIHLGEVVIAEHETEAKAKDLYGLQISTCARVMSLAQRGQVLMTRGVFDSARQALKGEDLPGVGPLSWANHGLYLLKGMEEPVEVCEVGEVGQGALVAPMTSEKAQRQVPAGEEPVLGWRPAVGQEVPNTPWVLEEKLGEGGFGEVWVGRHPQLKERRVFKFCFRADRVRSLKREVTLFRLLKERVGEHPHIVRLHEVYFDQPPYYLEEEYVEGKDLRTWCEAQGGVEKVPLEVRLEMVAQAAEALQAAHDAGIIHRDVKPGNILVSLGSTGRWPGAFGGSPKAVSVDADASGEPPSGSPLSEWPESAVGSATGPSAFSLQPSALAIKLADFGIGQVISAAYLKGVTQAGFTQTMLGSTSSRTGTTMYLAPEMIAGAPATTRSDIYSLGVVLYQLLIGDFRRPVTGDWADDVKDGLLREDLRHCLAGKPEERFAGAAQLTTNLRAWEQRKAEQAERERVRRHAERRHKLLLASGAVALGLGALAAALGYGLREARREREQQRRLAYASDMKAAQVAVQENNRGLAVNLLQRHMPNPGEVDLRGIEWRYLWHEASGTERHSLPHLLSLTDVSFSPDGRTLATATFDKLVQLWDLASERQVGEFQGGGSLPAKRCLGFTADGNRFVFRGRHDIEVRETSGWQLLTNLPCADNSPLALSRNGRRLVCQLWTGAQMEMHAWDLATWECRKLPGRGTYCYGLAVNADGTLAALSEASTGWQGPVHVWDIPGNSCVPLIEKSDVASFAFSPDGKWLAAGHFSGQVGLWDLRTRRRIHAWRAHHGFVYGLAFSPDGTRLASGGNDQVIALWETGTTNRLDQLSGHQGEIQCLTFSADGRQIASGSSDNTAKVWDLQTGQSANQAKGLTLPTNALPICPSADGDGLFTLNEKKDAVSLWNLRSGQLLWSCSRSSLQPVEGGSLAYFLKQRRAVGFGTNRLLRVWEMTSPKQLLSVSLPFSSLQPACLSPDQRWLVAHADSKVWLFDLHTGRQVSGFAFPYQFSFSADFSPDGRLLAVSTVPPSNRGDPDIHLWDLHAGKERLRCPGLTYFTALRFSPDSKLLASGDFDSKVQLWSAETGQPLWPALKGHQSVVGSCSFSADGKTLITGGWDSTLRFWSVAAGREILMLPQALPMSASLFSSLEILYRAQTEVNPAPDALIWQDIGRGTRLISLPTLSDVDRVIAHRQEQLAEETRRAQARKQREASRQAAIARDPGAIKQWLILGPIPLALGQTAEQGLDAEWVADEARLRPRAGEQWRTAGGELAWRSVHLTDHAMDFGDLLGAAEHAAAYAVAYVSVPAPRANLSLLVGSDDQAKVYLNGQQVYRRTEIRALDPDQDTVSGIELRKGINVLVFKVVNVTAAWGGSLRIADSAGEPVTGITVLASPP